MHNMSSQRAWDKMNMENLDYEEHYYDVEDTYVSTVRKLKQRSCCVCKGNYETELTQEDKVYLKKLREEYDIKFHPDIDIEKFHAGIKIK